MKNFKYYIITFIILVTIAISFSIDNSVSANQATIGAELFSKCSPCHTEERRNLAGYSQEKLFEEFHYYQSHIFNSGSSRKMSQILDELSDNEETILANHINQL